MSFELNGRGRISLLLPWQGVQGVQGRGAAAGAAPPHPWQDSLRPDSLSAERPELSGCPGVSWRVSARGFHPGGISPSALPWSQTAAGTQGWLCFPRAFLIHSESTESMGSGESSEQLSLPLAFPLKRADSCPGCEKSWLA